jgi:hypothetical protein
MNRPTQLTLDPWPHARGFARLVSWFEYPHPSGFLLWPTLATLWNVDRGITATQKNNLISPHTFNQNRFRQLLWEC